MNKEEIYDEQISPLMQKIIAISREHGIAMMASFAIGHDGEGPNGEDCTNLVCNTLLPDGDDEPNPVFTQANALIRRNGGGFHLRQPHLSRNADPWPGNDSPGRLKGSRRRA